MLLNQWLRHGDEAERNLADRDRVLATLAWRLRQTGMPARYVIVDRETPLLLPPDLRDWVPADHLVHFIIDAVAELDLRSARVNERGSGSEQYPPAMMLGLLVYSYATGVFGSRRIEQSTSENVAVRLLCADTHPDHDTICTFRRQNRELLAKSFAQVLELAARCRVLKVGEITVAIDGTKVLANASRHSAVSHGRAGEQLQQVELEIAQLLAKAEAADAQPLQDGLTIEGELTRRHERKARYKLRQQTVEPVFGIVKAAMGFRRFLLRGLEKVSLEWTLVALADNFRRLHALGATLKRA